MLNKINFYTILFTFIFLNSVSQLDCMKLKHVILTKKIFQTILQKNKFSSKQFGIVKNFSTSKNDDFFKKLLEEKDQKEISNKIIDNSSKLNNNEKIEFIDIKSTISKEDFDKLLAKYNNTLKEIFEKLSTEEKEKFIKIKEKIDNGEKLNIQEKNDLTKIDRIIENTFVVGKGFGILVFGVPAVVILAVFAGYTAHTGWCIVYGGILDILESLGITKIK